MSTLFAHAAVGAAIAGSLPRRLRSWAVVVAAVVVATVPDVDVVAFQLDIPYGAPFGHRGLTHSLAFAALSGVTAAWVVAWRRGRSMGGWTIAAALFLAAVSHGVLDAATDAGLGVGFFLPFDETRFFWPLRPLATSPVSAGAFLADPGRAFQILGNEARWIGLPVLVTLAAGRLLRRNEVEPRRSILATPEGDGP